MKKIVDKALKEMIEMAIKARKKAYAPYSHHPVGAALLADDGVIYNGCNVENAAYPLSFCAEPNAIGNMIMGGGRTIEHVVVAGPGEHICTPCGGCRQQLREFAGDSDVGVTICDVNGMIVKETSLSALLPSSFGPENVAEVSAEE